MNKFKRVVGRMLLATAATFSANAQAAQDLQMAPIGPFTVLPSPDAHEINVGAKAYFAQVNARGGVNGRRIAVFELDDKFNADEFSRQFDEAMQRQPVALLSPVGSAALSRVVRDKLLDKHDMVVVNAVPGSETFRKPGHPNLFHVRAGDRQQTEKIITNASTMGISRVQVLYQDLPIGAAGMDVVKQLAAASGGALVAGGVQSKHDDAALADAARAVLKNGEPQGVLLVARPSS